MSYLSLISILMPFMLNYIELIFVCDANDEDNGNVSVPERGPGSKMLYIKPGGYAYRVPEKSPRAKLPGI